MKPSLLPIAFGLLLAIPAALGAQQPERYTLDGGPAAVYNLVGALRLEPGEGPVTVEVTRAGGDAARLQVAHDELAGRPTLRVVYPGNRIRSGRPEGHGSTQLRVREDGTFGDQGDSEHGRRHHDGGDEGRRVTITDGSDGLDARADLVIRVPRGGEVAAYLAVGAVTIANVDGELRVDSHSAPVTASGTRGSLSVDVGAGDVRITQAQGEVDVDTGSGDVNVSGFRGTTLSIETGSGGIKLLKSN
jgi:hypothetical protein